MLEELWDTLAFDEVVAGPDEVDALADDDDEAALLDELSDILPFDEVVAGPDEVDGFPEELEAVAV